MASKIYTIITMAQRHQFLINVFFIWYVHTRMYEEFLEFFPEFFDLIISINRIFFCKELSEVVSGQCIYCITLCIHVLFHNFWVNLQI